MSTWSKALQFICFFGALALAAWTLIGRAPQQPALVLCLAFLAASVLFRGLETWRHVAVIRRSGF